MLVKYPMQRVTGTTKPAKISQQTIPGIAYHSNDNYFLICKHYVENHICTLGYSSGCVFEK